MNSNQRLKARLILFVILLFAVALVYSLYWTQVEKGQYYFDRAEKQYARPAVNSFDRGSILFSAKDGTRIAAATLGSGYLVVMNPTLVEDREATFEALSQYLDLDKEDFLRRSAKRPDLYEELASRVSENDALSIKALSLSGISLIKENWRQYPGGVLASQTIGLLGQSASSTSVSGRYGLERSYEKILNRRKASFGSYSFAGIFSDFKDTFFGSDESDQGDIVTTIEPTTQKYLEKILTETAEVWRADEIGGIIIDPATGEITALAVLPGFDLNDTVSIKDVSRFANPLVEHVYEMGSIMKPLTMAVALDSGAIGPDSTYDDTGTMTLSGKKISNFDGRARGLIPVKEILSQSLNVGAATIALKVGKDDFAKYFMNFGLGSKTAIDLPNEASSLVGNLKTGRDVEIATAAYGQGIAVSPINMTRALSVLANGGYVVTPHVVKQINYLNGKTEVKNYAKSGPVMKKETGRDVTEMLVEVVDTALLKGALKMDRYRIAAKTGTAQIPDPNKGGYYSDRYLHSFFGYFPAYDPKFLVFLYQIHPKGAEYASLTLTEPFDQVAKFLINYYNIPPDR